MSPWACLVLAITTAGLAATALGFTALLNEVSDRRSDSVQFAVSTLERSITDRVDGLGDGLITLRNTFHVRGTPTRREFRSQVDSGFRDGVYPEGTALELVTRVTQARLRAFERSLGRELGDPTFRISSAGTGSGDLYVVEYVEPRADNEAALGFDIGSDPARLAAIERSRDQNLVVATGPIELVQDPGRAGFLLIAPLYEGGLVPSGIEARQRLFRGAIVTVVRSRDLFDGLGGDSLDFTVTDVAGPIERRLFPAIAPTEPDEVRFGSASVGGREWLIEVDAASIPSSSAVSLWVVLAGGVALSLLLGITAASIARARAEAEDARSAAEEASKAKSAFLATMSHEIRTPMIGVTGMLELLAQTQLTDQQRRMLRTAEGSSRSMLQIIGDILDLSKIEAARLELAPVALDLRSVLGDAVDGFRYSASAKGLLVTWNADPHLADAHVGDPLRLRQIVANLVSNSVKFTEEGGVTVEVTVVDDSGETQTIAIAVADTGDGMTPEQQQKLFIDFAQADAVSARRFGGTGLGLAICQRLATLMGGEITVDSAPGHGTTMLFTVPLPVADPSDVVAFTADAAHPLDHEAKTHAPTG